jgi:hypothetical protein
MHKKLQQKVLSSRVDTDVDCPDLSSTTHYNRHQNGALPRDLLTSEEDESNTEFNINALTTTDGEQQRLYTLSKGDNYNQDA